jgi:hypothetical protein
VKSNLGPISCDCRGFARLSVRGMLSDLVSQNTHRVPFRTIAQSTDMLPSIEISFLTKLSSRMYSAITDSHLRSRPCLASVLDVFSSRRSPKAAPCLLARSLLQSRRIPGVKRRYWWEQGSPVHVSRKANLTWRSMRCISRKSA